MPRSYSRTRAWGCAANAGGWLPAQTDVVPGKWHGKFPKEKATEEQLKHVGYKNLIR